MPILEKNNQKLNIFKLTKNENDFLEFVKNREKYDINSLIGAGETLLHIAVWKGYKNGAIELLKKGAHLNIKEKVNNNNTAVHLAVIKNDIEMLEILLDTNPDLWFSGVFNVFNIVNIDNFTPLMWAEKKGYKEIIQLLNIDSIVNRIKNKLREDLNKCENFYDKFKNKIFEDFENSVDDCYKKLENEVQLLQKENNRLESKKNKWLKFITFGFFNWRISRKKFKNAQILNAKRLEFDNKIKKIEEMYKSIKELLALHEVKKENENLKKIVEYLRNCNNEQEQMIREMKTKLEKVEQENNNYKQESNNKNSKINKLNEDLVEKQKKIDELTEENQAYKNLQGQKNDKTVSIIKLYQEKIKTLKENLEISRKEIDRLNKLNDNKLVTVETAEEAINFDAQRINKSEQAADTTIVEGHLTIL